MAVQQERDGIYEQLEKEMDRFVEESKSWSLGSLEENFMEVALEYRDSLSASIMFGDTEAKRFKLIQRGYTLLHELGEVLGEIDELRLSS